MDGLFTTSSENGRDERIRTSDHLTPSQVRYQAALRPDNLFKMKWFSDHFNGGEAYLNLKRM